MSAALAKLKQEFRINPAEDLNKLSDKELRHRKAIMDLSFEKNRLDKDHPDFVYDKQVDFSGKLRSNWVHYSSSWYNLTFYFIGKIKLLKNQVSVTYIR